MPNSPIYRRDFLGQSTAAAALGGLATVVLAERAAAAEPKVWQPVSDRKVRVGIVGYGYCKFGAAFGFQDHPNVEIVAVSDLFPDRRDGLMKACRCEKSYPSLEELVKDDTIEAVAKRYFVIDKADWFKHSHLRAIVTPRLTSDHTSMRT